VLFQFIWLCRRLLLKFPWLAIYERPAAKPLIPAITAASLTLNWNPTSEFHLLSVSETRAYIVTDFVSPDSAFSSAKPMATSIFRNSLAEIMSGLSLAMLTSIGSNASTSGFSGIPQFSRQSAFLGSNLAWLMNRCRLITWRSATSIAALALSSVKLGLVNSFASLNWKPYPGEKKLMFNSCSSWWMQRRIERLSQRS